VLLLVFSSRTRRALPDDYKEAKKGECPATVAAVMAEGKTVGSTLYVCTDKQCKVHHPRVTISPEEREQRRKQARRFASSRNTENGCSRSFASECPPNPLAMSLTFVARRYFEQPRPRQPTPHLQILRVGRNHTKGQRRVRGLPETGQRKTRKDDHGDIGKFLFVCALASDLYCPTYVGGGMLTKDSNLAREAAHYKVNAERILHELKEKPASKTGKNSLTSAKAKPHIKKQ